MTFAFLLLRPNSHMIPRPCTSVMQFASAPGERLSFFSEANRTHNLQYQGIF